MASDFLNGIAGYKTILDENGSPLRSRSVLKINGATALDDGTKTVVNFAGLSSGEVWRFQEDLDGIPAVSGASITGTALSLGRLCARAGAGTGTLTIPAVTGVSGNHFGVARFQTGATSGNNVAVFGGHLNNSVAPAVFSMTSIASFRAVVMLNTLTTMQCQIGLAANMALHLNAQNAVFVYAPATSANWLAVNRDAVTASVDTGVPVVTQTWYDLQIKQVTAGVFTYFINGVAVPGPGATNAPSGDGNFGLRVETLTAAAREVALDYIEVVSRPIVRSAV